MEMFISNQGAFSIQCHLVQECLHHWKWSMKSIGNLNIGIVHVVMNICVYMVVCQEFLQWSNVHHPTKWFGSPLLHLLHLPGEYKHFGHTLKTVIIDHVYDAAFVTHCKGKEPYLLWCHHHQRSCMSIFSAQV